MYRDRDFDLSREGSEIARQVIRALTQAGIRIIFVTHLYDLAERLPAGHDGTGPAESADQGKH